jgi:acyl-CoA synthetase (NDP forming)
MRDFTPLFDPRSVAILGASADPAKWGNSVSRQLLSLPSGRDIYLVNRAGGAILGQPAHRSLADLPSTVDLVAICVPASGFLEAVRDALAAGARALVAITAGMGEVSDDGREIERQAVTLVRAAGAVLVGPNCLGITDNSTGLRLASDPFRPGDVAVLSQSGNMVIDLESLMADEAIGVSRFVSLGNQADVDVTDFMLDCVGHEATRAVAVYVEDVKDGRAFVGTARALTGAGKPVVLLAPGGSEGGRRGAASHTGSMTSPDNVIQAACDASGIQRVRTPLQMVDALVALRQPYRAASTRVAILTDGGGHGSVAADCLHAQGLDVPVLSEGLGAELRQALWTQSAVTNPVDLAGIGEQDPLSYARGLESLLGSNEVDSVLMTGYFGGYAATNEALAEPETRAAHRILEVIRGAGKPVVVQSIFPGSASIEVLRAAGVPIHRDISRASAALSMVVRADHPSRADSLVIPPSESPALASDYETTRAVLAQRGVPFPPSATFRTADELDEALRRATVPFPIVLKALGLLHKSDSGGVLLGISDEAAAKDAYRDLDRRLRPSAVSMEAMVDVPDSLEVIVGSSWDPRFGPVLMVGLGGLFTEVMQDVAFALAPVGRVTGLAMLRSLRGAPLLQGIRGRGSVALEALIDVVVAVGETAARHPEWSELEVNPVIVSPGGAVAVDARSVMRA